MSCVRLDVGGKSRPLEILDLFPKEGLDPRPLRRRYAYKLYSHFIQLGTSKRIYQTIQNHHSTPTNPTTGEENIIMTLCPENTNSTPTS
jgi:hypothetical protein